MTHARLVEMAEAWLRRSRCGIVLSEQGCSSGEMPDAIGWKGKNHSIVIECKISRSDFLADSSKPWRTDPEIALGCERYYAAPIGMLKALEMPVGWGLLEAQGREMTVAKKSLRKLRQPEGLMNEMNLLLASLRRVEVRIEPQRISDFLKWKNRMAVYMAARCRRALWLPSRKKTHTWFDRRTVYNRRICSRIFDAFIL